MNKWKAQAKLWKHKNALQCRKEPPSGRRCECVEVKAERKVRASFLDTVFVEEFELHNGGKGRLLKVSKYKWCSWSSLTRNNGWVSEEKHITPLEKRVLMQRNRTLSYGAAEKWRVHVGHSSWMTLGAPLSGSSEMGTFSESLSKAWQSEGGWEWCHLSASLWSLWQP